MSEISAEQRELLKRLGMTDEMIEERANQIPNTKKKKLFTPTPKKHLRVSTCVFCKTTSVTYYILQEEDWCSWVGCEVSKEKYFETEAVKSKPTQCMIQSCPHCFSYLQTKTKEELEDMLFKILLPTIGKML